MAKIRNGFVSNSSSSSFIIALDKPISKPSDVMKMIFSGKSRKDKLDYLSFSVTYGDMADKIYDSCHNFFSDVNDIIHKKVIDWNGEEIELGYEYFIDFFSDYYKMHVEFDKKFPELKKGYDKYWKNRNPDSKKYIKYYRAYEDAFKKFEYDKIVPKIEEWFNKNKGRIFYIFEFSDNGEGELGIVMEHGEIFKNVPHIIRSNH